MGLRPIVLIPLLGLLAACGPSLPTGAPAPGTTPTSAATAATVPPVTSPAVGSGAAATLVDPCQALRIPDVQPFFTAQVVTELPALLQSDTEKSCEFSTTDKASSLLVDYLVGDGAQTKLFVHNEPGGDAVAVSGVGDGASHPHGDASLLFSWKGSGAAAAVCTVTTTGLQFALRPSGGEQTDDQATQVDQQYGTLCNKIYGSGPTTPTVPSVSVAPASTLPADTSALPGDSANTLPGSGVPLPAGVDCSGSHTTTGGVLGIDCETMVSDPQGIYQWFLGALPRHGYTINSQAFTPGGNGLVAVGRIMFTNAADGLCFVSIIGTKLSVSKQQS